MEPKGGTPKSLVFAMYRKKPPKILKNQNTGISSI